MAAGRPIDYNEDISTEICERIACGQSVRAISRDESMPAMSTIFLWLKTHKEFSEQYAEAKDQGCIAMAEEILGIADDGSNDYMERLADDGECMGYKTNGEAINRSRLRVDTRKWLLSKMMPKKYGDKIATELSGPDGKAIPIDAVFEFIPVGNDK